MSISATYFGSNGWLIELQRINVLVDPWLKGELRLTPFDWIIKGQLIKDWDIPPKLDLLLLTQAVADHAHPPTLKALPKNLPVIASEKAAALVKDMGFENVSSIQPGEEISILDLKIRATKGAAVPNIENGYILNSLNGSCYIEPHGYLDKSIGKELLDVIITPLIDIKLPLTGSFIKGKTVLPDLIDNFRPLTVLASTTGGDAKFTGLLTKFFQTNGSIEETYNSLPKEVSLVDPIPGHKYTLNTRS